MLSFYQLALNEFNKGQPSYCNPRKGTADYLAVKQYADELEIAKNLKKKKAAKPKAVSAPAPKPKSAPKTPKSDGKDKPKAVQFFMDPKQSVNSQINDQLKKLLPKPKTAPKPATNIQPQTAPSNYMDYLNTIVKKHTGPEKQYIEKTIDLVNKSNMLMSKSKAMPYKLIVDLDKLRNSVITAEKYASMTKNTLSDKILLEQLIAAVKYRNKYTENDTLESLSEIQRDDLELNKEKLQQFLDAPISKGALFKSRLVNFHNSWLKNSIPKHLKKDLLLLLQKVATKYKYKDMVKSIEAYLDGDLIFI